MPDDIVLRADHVSKKFCRTLKHVMIYGAKDIASNMVGLSSHSERLRNGEFWAVDDVSFELRWGETLGLIGPNGSGKSTMLKMINGIFMPDKGSIEIKGRVGALIEVGAGLHPMLTGRENIYVNGAILGMSKKEIDRKFDEIVDFADIGDFIDAPVKHYSSGMHVRLGFAIAAHCEPDILLVDEVLAVGDISFQNKCLNRISELFKSGNTTIIFVSHDMNAVRLLCNRCLVLNNGVMMLDGPSAEAVKNFANMIFGQKKSFNSNILKMSLVDTSKEVVSDIECRGTYSLLLEFDNLYLDKGLLLAFSFVNLETKFSYRLETESFRTLNGSLSSKRILVRFRELNLPGGTYTIRFAISDGNYINRIHHFDETIYFTVNDNPGSPRFLQAEWSEY